MTTIAELFGMPMIEGRRYGVEFEVEYARTGGNPDALRVPGGWERTRDDSLRNGIELVSQPCTALSAARSMVQIYSSWDEAGLTTSPRCGIHVHVNVTDRTPQQLRALTAGFALVEPLIADFCGIEREQNVYCVPMYWLTESVPSLARWLTYTEEGQLNGLRSTAFWSKYTSFNIGRLFDLGTVELRMCPTFQESDRTLMFLRAVFSLDEACFNITSGEIENDVLAGDEVALTRRLIPSIANEYDDDYIDASLTRRDSQWTALQLCRRENADRWGLRPKLSDPGENGVRLRGPVSSARF